MLALLIDYCPGWKRQHTFSATLIFLFRPLCFGLYMLLRKEEIRTETDDLNPVR